MKLHGKEVPLLPKTHWETEVAKAAATMKYHFMQHYHFDGLTNHFMMHPTVVQ